MRRHRWSSAGWYRAGIFAAVSCLIILGAAPTRAGQPQTSERAEKGELIYGVKAENFGETTLEDGQFSYAVEAGTLVEDGIELINYQDESVVVRIYPADVRSNEGGPIVPAQRDEAMEGVGAWIELADEELATVGLPPRQRRTVPFVVKVPEHTPPGDYVGAIVTALDVGRGQSGLTVQTRAALMVRIHIPGEIDLDVAVGDIQARRTDAGLSLEVLVKNTGNVLFTTRASVELRRGGAGLSTLDLDPPDLYVIPGGEARLTGVWSNPPTLARVKAQARVDAAINSKPAGRFYGRPKTLSFMPRLLIAIAVAVLMVLLIGTALYRKRRARRRIDRSLSHAMDRHHADVVVESEPTREAVVVCATSSVREKR